MKRILYSAALILLAACGSATAAEIRWKFKQGDEFYLEEAARMKLAMQIGGDNETIEIRSSVVSRYKVAKLHANGNVEIEQTIIRFKMREGAGPEVRLPMLEEAVFKITFDRDMKLVRFDGYRDLVDRVERENPAAAGMFRREFSETEVRRRLVEPLTIFLPGKNDGDRWEHRRNTSNPAVGEIDMNLKYQMGDPVEKNGRNLLKADFTADVTYRQPMPKPGAELQVVRAAFDFKGLGGQVLFDSERGRLQQFEIRIPLTGTIRIKGGSVEMDGRIDGSIEQTFRVFDELPAD